MMKKSNIEWCDFTWDPVTGCRNDCSFCESRKRLSHFKGDIRFHLSDERIHIDEERSLYVITTPLAKNGSSVPAPTGFYPTLHPYRLQQVIQKIKPANIWVCHSGDLFGEWIPTEWILQVFEAAKQAPWHNYMFLTMNPNRYEELLETGVLMPTDNFWYGTRLTERGNVFTADGYHTFLCIEPMRLFAERMEIPNVEWILLGGYGKEFVRSFSEAVAEEVRSTGVTVTALCPGPTATGFEQAAQMKNSHMFSMFKPASAAAVAEAGFRAAQKGKTLRYCGWPTHTVSIAARLLPRSVCRRFMMKVNG